MRSILQLARLLAGIALLSVPVRAESGAPAATIRLGSGRATVNEYSLDSRLLRSYVGLERPVDVTPLGDGSILIVDEATRSVLVVDIAGTVTWRQQSVPHPLRARPRPKGGFLITSINEVIAANESGDIDWRLHVKDVRAAVPLKNGNVLATTTDRDRWLTEITPAGIVVSETEAPPVAEPDGATAKEKLLSSPYVWSLDVGVDGQIFTTDFDGQGPVEISPDRRDMQRMSGITGTRDTRIGPAGEWIVVSPPDSRVSWQMRDGTVGSIQLPLTPLSASMSPRGTLLVGLEGEHAAMNASHARNTERLSFPWWRRGLPLPLLGAAFAFFLAICLRWRDSGKQPLQAVVLPQTVGDPSPTTGLPPGRSRGAGAALASFWASLLAIGCYLAWQGSGTIEATGYTAQSLRFPLGALVAGVALRALNGMAGCASTWSSFLPSFWNSPARRPDRFRTVFLMGLAAGSFSLVLYVLRYAPEEQATAVACWLAAQIWILAAAYPSVRSTEPEQAPPFVLVLLGLVILAAAVTRFWQIGYYPDFVHHDHGLFGDEIVRARDGHWTPFFERGYSVGRPWFLPTILGLALFGTEYWILRLTAAVAGVVLSGASYLLASTLFNRRVGLIAALLVTVNHLLLLYSRQPYVLDPAAPFVLALYCAAVGLRRGCRLHWCIAGVLTGWALLGYYVSITYMLALGAILIYLACFHSRAAWRARSGFLWFGAGLCIVYLPILVQTGDSAILHRAQSIVVFLQPDGSIRWDADLWAHQFERSFGYIFRAYPDYPWGISTGLGICDRYVSCLFGIGVVYLLLCWRAVGSFVLVVSIFVCIFFGSTILPTPPGPYHLLTAIVAIMMTGAVALDRVLALTDRWRSAFWRTPARLAALALLVAISATNVGAVWNAVRRPPPTEDGRTVFLADAPVMAARFIRDHPEYRYFLVRSPGDRSSRDATFRFFASNSDLSDVSTPLEEVLPVPPVDPAAAACFLVLPSRSSDRHALTSAYPNGKTEEVLFGRYGTGSLWTHTVDARTVRDTYEANR